jgi:hypothetical protein
MRFAWLHLLGVCCVVVFAGCGGDKRMNVKGRITKGGAAFIVPEDDFVRVTFVPVMPGGDSPLNCYIAEYNNKEGTFKALGADLTGIPPGKYRITVAHERNRKDLLKGAFDIDKTPFSFDIRSPSEEIVLALDKAKPCQNGVGGGCGQSAAVGSMGCSRQRRSHRPQHRRVRADDLVVHKSPSGRMDRAVVRAIVGPRRARRFAHVCLQGTGRHAHRKVECITQNFTTAKAGRAQEKRQPRGRPWLA